MGHEADYHAKLVPALLLGPRYALLYVRFNSSGDKQPTAWSDAQIKAHINEHYPWHNNGRAHVLADAATKKPALTTWSKGLQSKEGNNIRHLFLLVPVANGKSATDYQHEVEDLEQDKYSSMHVYKERKVLEWAVMLAYSALKSLDPNWTPTIASK